MIRLTRSDAGLFGVLGAIALVCAVLAVVLWLPSGEPSGSERPDMRQMDADQSTPLAVHAGAAANTPARQWISPDEVVATAKNAGVMGAIQGRVEFNRTNWEPPFQVRLLEITIAANSNDSLSREVPKLRRVTSTDTFGAFAFPELVTGVYRVEVLEAIRADSQLPAGIGLSLPTIPGTPLGQRTVALGPSDEKHVVVVVGELEPGLAAVNGLLIGTQHGLRYTVECLTVSDSGSVPGSRQVAVAPDGFFELRGLEPGNVVLSALAIPPSGESAFELGSRSVTVAPGEIRDILLELAPHRVMQVKVQDAFTGSALPHGSFRYTKVKSTPRSSLQGFTQLDSEGRAVALLPVDEYHLFVAAGGYAAQQRAVSVAIGEGTLEVVFELEQLSPWSTLVLEETGGPLTSVRLRFLDFGGVALAAGVQPVVSTDAQGMMENSFLPPGAYRVQVGHRDAASSFGTLLLEEGAPTTFLRVD